MSQLGETLQKLMRIRGLNQREFARAIGISEGALGDVLNGRTTSVRSNNLAAMADALQVSADILLGRAPLLLDKDPKALAIVEVMSAIENLGWEEIARRIKQDQTSASTSPTELPELPMPDNDPNDIPPGWEKLIRKSILNSGRKAPKKPKGK